MAFPEALGDRPGPTEHDRQAGAVPQVRRRPHRDAAHAADPFLARRRTGCYRAAGSRDAAQLERRGVLRLILAVVVAWHWALRRPEPQARLGSGRAVRLGAE